LVQEEYSARQIRNIDEKLVVSNKPLLTAVQ